jgi:hypothetical protein
MNEAASAGTVTVTVLLAIAFCCGLLESVTVRVTVNVPAEE